MAVQTLLKQGMLSALVGFDLILPTCLILALVTRIFDFFMDTLLVSLKIVLTCCLISRLLFFIYFLFI